MTTKILSEIVAGDRNDVGGKAYNCARLLRAGFPVPGGIVLPVSAGEKAIDALSSHPWVVGCGERARFAVRSSGLAEDSGEHSFAGVHETYLNIDRPHLADAVRRCRHSADSEQARAYRAANRLPGSSADIAVLIQQMVAAVASGVAFSVNPVTGENQLVIESVEGLGDALVSGLVTPEERTLPKTDPSELAQLVVRIERFFGVPQDIEWCFDGSQYWIVQSRPITTSIKKPRTQIDRRLPATSSSVDVEWTRANLAEVFPDQLSPQALEFYLDLLNRGERAFFGRLMAPESALGPMMKAFHGRLYFNLTQLRHVTKAVGAAFANSLRSLGHSEQIERGDEVASMPPLGLLIRALPDIVRLAITSNRLGAVFRAHQARTARTIERLHAVAARLSDQDIWATIAWWVEIAPASIPAVLAMSSVQYREDILRQACRRVGIAYEEFVYPQLAAGERSVSSKQAFDLAALATIARNEPPTASYLRANDGTFADIESALSGTAFLPAFNTFLAEYGHRGRYESDWSLPRMHENPAPVLFAIREHLAAAPVDPAGVAARQGAEAAAAWRRFESRLTLWQRLVLLPRVRLTVRQLKQQYLWREQVRSDLTRVLDVLRPWHLTLAGRFVERGWLVRRDDYFLLHLSEVAAACLDPDRGPGLPQIAAARARQLQADRDLRLPLFMRESQLLSLLAASHHDAATRADELHGLCVSPGIAEGAVVVMRDPADFAKMTRGAILVAPATDPSWTPLFTLAAGVIVEVGGMLSHASTIAREYGLPALANVKNATTILRTGDRVRLNASAGQVQRI